MLFLSYLPHYHHLIVYGSGNVACFLAHSSCEAVIGSVLLKKLDQYSFVEQDLNPCPKYILCRKRKYVNFFRNWHLPAVYAALSERKCRLAESDHSGVSANNPTACLREYTRHVSLRATYITANQL